DPILLDCVKRRYLIAPEEFHHVMIQGDFWRVWIGVCCARCPGKPVNETVSPCSGIFQEDRKAENVTAIALLVPVFLGLVNAQGAAQCLLDNRADFRQRPAIGKVERHVKLIWLEHHTSTTVCG